MQCQIIKSLRNKIEEEHTKAKFEAIIHKYDGHLIDRCILTGMLLKKA